MVKKLLFTFLLLINFICFAQENRSFLSGKIISDSLSLENIHVINLTAKKATITDAKGNFFLPAKESDTIMFSAVQFQKELIIITKSIIKNKKVHIRLTPEINILEEVYLTNNALSGNFRNDVENYKLKNYVDEFTLNLPNVGKAPKTKIDRIRLRFNQYSGIVGSLYGWISGNNKRLEKIEKLAIEDYYLEKIRLFIKDDNFANLMHIPKDKINLFLEFCKPKKIIELYKKGEKYQVIDILLTESKIFLQTIKNDKK